MGAPKSSAAYDPLWAEVFNRAFEQELSYTFEHEKQAKNFQRKGNYYRTARRQELVAAKRLKDIIDNPGDVEAWLYRAEKVEIVVRNLHGVGWQVIMRNKMDNSESEALAAMISNSTEVSNTPSEEAQTAAEETSGIPSMYRTGLD